MQNLFPFKILVKSLSAAGKTHRIFDFYHEIKIDYTGYISLNFPDAILTTWCINPQENWPNEHLECDISFGLEAGPLQKLPLIYDDKRYHDTVDSLSEWHLHKISVNPIEKGIMARFSDKDIVQTMDGDISLIFEISRNSMFYKSVFSVPILGKELGIYIESYDFNIIFYSLSNFNNFIVFAKRLSSWCPDIGGDFNFNVGFNVYNQTCSYTLCS